MDGDNAKLVDREPVAVVSSITNAIKTLVLAVLALALAFNWVNWSDAQNAAVLGVVAAGFVLISAIGAVIVRHKVTPVATSNTPSAPAPVVPTTPPAPPVAPAVVAPTAPAAG
jgi:hypothetical protein